MYYLHNPEYLLAMVGHLRYKEVMLNVFKWLRVKIENNQIVPKDFYVKELMEKLEVDNINYISDNLPSY